MFLDRYQCVLIRPISAFNSNEISLDLSKVVRSVKLTFQAESPLDLSPVFRPWGQVPFTWYCLDCYVACGNKDDVFRSSPATGSEISKSNGPTQEQREEIANHCHQHQIIWAWVRSIDK